VQSVTNEVLRFTVYHLQAERQASGLVDLAQNCDDWRSLVMESSNLQPLTRRRRRITEVQFCTTLLYSLMVCWLQAEVASDTEDNVEPATEPSDISHRDVSTSDTAHHSLNTVCVNLINVFFYYLYS